MTDPDAPLPRPFRDPARAPGPLPVEAIARILAAAGDIVLIMSDDGQIVDLAVSSADLAADGAAGWTDFALVDLVTSETKPKVREMLADAAAGRPSRWRQVNHAIPNGEVPVRYHAIGIGDRVIAIGRDLRQAAAAQQRLLQAQQSLERDYMRLRQAESRYRLLFDLAAEPVLLVEAATRRISEANPAAHALLGREPGTLARQPVTTIAAADAQEPLVAFLGGATVAGGLAPLTMRLATGTEARLSASAFRQNGATYLLVRLATGSEGAVARGGDDRLAQVIERMPDAFVIVDRQMAVLAANAAFVELVQAASAAQVTGGDLGQWLGRPGIDLELILGQLREHGVARNVATILRGAAGGQEEVEVSAAAVRAGEGDVFGFAIRGVGRRLRDLPPPARDLPRSVEQLTELVGRMSLKEIVRESTDLIERLCIEAALSYTSDNRASAAEILGLSRQGLYLKLNRHGLGSRDEDAA